MTTQATPTLEVATTDVDERFNARTRQNSDGLGGLSASISSSQKNRKDVAR